MEDEAPAGSLVAVHRRRSHLRDGLRGQERRRPRDRSSRREGALDREVRRASVPAVLSPARRSGAPDACVRRRARDRVVRQLRSRRARPRRQGALGEAHAASPVRLRRRQLTAPVRTSSSSRDGAPEAGILGSTRATAASSAHRSPEYGESHGTPFLWHNKDRSELVSPGPVACARSTPAPASRCGRWMV